MLANFTFLFFMKTEKKLNSFIENFYTAFKQTTRTIYIFYIFYCKMHMWFDKLIKYGCCIFFALLSHHIYDYLLLRWFNLNGQGTNILNLDYIT